MDQVKLIEEVAVALQPFYFANVSPHTTAVEYRKMFEAHARAVGRVVAVLMTDEIGPDIRDKIEQAERHMVTIMVPGSMKAVQPGGDLAELSAAVKRGDVAE